MRSAFYEKKSLPAQLIFSHKLGDAPHLHKEIEIIYVAEGEAVAHADRNCESICKDSLFISFPNQIHFYESCHPGEYYILIVRPELFFGLSSTFRDYIPEHNTFAEAQELFPYIHQAFSAEGEYRDTMIAGSLSMMMCRLLPQLSLRKKSRQKSIEEKFDLAPWEEFAKETEDDEDRAEEKMGRELLRAAGRLTGENELQKQFLPRKNYFLPAKQPGLILFHLPNRNLAWTAMCISPMVRVS